MTLQAKFQAITAAYSTPNADLQSLESKIASSGTPELREGFKELKDALAKTSGRITAALRAPSNKIAKALNAIADELSGVSGYHKANLPALLAKIHPALTVENDIVKIDVVLQAIAHDLFLPEELDSAAWNTLKDIYTDIVDAETLADAVLTALANRTSSDDAEKAEAQDLLAKVLAIGAIRTGEAKTKVGGACSFFLNPTANGEQIEVVTATGESITASVSKEGLEMLQAQLAIATSAVAQNIKKEQIELEYNGKKIAIVVLKPNSAATRRDTPIVVGKFKTGKDYTISLAAQDATGANALAVLRAVEALRIPAAKIPEILTDKVITFQAGRNNLFNVSSVNVEKIALNIADLNEALSEEKRKDNEKTAMQEVELHLANTAQETARIQQDTAMMSAVFNGSLNSSTLDLIERLRGLQRK